MRTSLLLAIVVMMSLPIASVQAQNILFVSQQATGANDGSSFTNAYPHLQDALKTAQPGDEIRVAAGIYRPDEGTGITDGDREASFFLKNGVRILGGFDPVSGARDWQQFETILSGDLLDNDTDNLSIDEPSRRDNSLHLVVAAAGTDTTAILDGFILRSAHADTAASLVTDGAGMLVVEDSTTHVKLANLVFEKNVADTRGGGLANFGGAMWLSNVSFLNNVAESRGGGLYHFPYRSAATAYIDHAFVAHNRAGSGGGFYITVGGLIVTESTFLQNQAAVGGAVMHQVNTPFLGGEAAIYANVSFLGNIGTEYGGAICSEDNSMISVYNGVFSGNKTIAPALVPGRGLGGAIVNLEFAQLILVHTIMVNNVAHDGGAIYNGSGDTFVYNSIFQSNTSTILDTGNLGMEPERGTISLDNNIFDSFLPNRVNDAGNNVILRTRLADALGPDGIAGTLDDDVRHAFGSPSIDAGDNSLLPTDFLDLDQDGNTTEPFPLDRDGKERIANGTPVDLGPYEFNASFPVATEHAYTAACPDGPLTAAYPNPFTTETHLNLCVPHTGPVDVRIFDVLGREQSIVLDRVVQEHQSYTLTINRGRLASGVYFVRMTFDDRVLTRSIILTSR